MHWGLPMCIARAAARGDANLAAFHSCSLMSSGCSLMSSGCITYFACMLQVTYPVGHKVM